MFSVKYDKYMYLKMFIDTQDEKLKQLYEQAALEHNNQILVGDFIDAGFDLYAPIDVLCTNEENINKIDFSIQCSAKMDCSIKKFDTGFYMFPRSSLSKTPLRLANSVGIIDSGYRGNIMGMFDCIRGEYTAKQYDRLVQICAPGLVPIYVEIVSNVSDLGKVTTRGKGGFGSTGGLNA